MMKKKHSKVNSSSRSHRKFQTRKDKTNKKQKKKKNKKTKKPVWTIVPETQIKESMTEKQCSMNNSNGCLSINHNMNGSTQL